MHVHDALDGRGHADERVSARRHLAEALAEHQQHVGIAHARRKLRVDADADVACVLRVPVVEEILVPERGCDRQAARLRKLRERIARRAIPAAAADDDERRPRAGKQRVRRGDGRRRRCADHRLHSWWIGAYRFRRQHVFGQCEHDGARAAGDRGTPRVCDVFGDARSAVDLRSPLGDRAEHLPVVDFLERLAVDHVAADLADERDQRRRILRGRVNADRRIGRARAACDEDEPGLSRELAVRLGHVRGTAFLPADEELQALASVVQRVEHREIALARHAERMRRALREQARDQDLAAGSLIGHRSAPRGRR